MILCIFKLLRNQFFRNYFKDVIVDAAQYLLINTSKLDEDYLSATYFEGDNQESKDKDIIEYWKKILPLERIASLYTKNIFQEIDKTSPHSLCTETYHDRVEDRHTLSLINAHNLHAIQIWNIVFM